MFQRNTQEILHAALAAMLWTAASVAEAREVHPLDYTPPPPEVAGLGDEPGNITFVIKSVTLPGQIKLQYVEHGDPLGVPVLLLHGYTDSWHSFELVLPHLPKAIRALALSQRGHGDSDRPANGYAPCDFAADAVAFMDALEIEGAIIVGHSMGSYVAQCIAINYPERTLGLVLVASFTTLQGEAGIQEFYDTAIAKLADPIDPSFALEFQKSTLYLPVPPEFLHIVVQESLKVPSYVWRAALSGLMATDFSGELGKITAPTLIVWGDKDAYFPRHHQDALRAGIEGSELVVYEGVGHGVHWEEPARFAAELEKFVAARASEAVGVFAR